jgi:uncharacterized membrane protein
MTRTTRHLLSLFVTGLLAALPLAATVAIFWWAASLVVRWLGPGSALGSVLVKIGLGVTGSEIVGYLVGVALLAGLVIGLGAFVQTRLQRSASTLLDALLRRIPVVRTVYDLAHRMVGLFKRGEADGLRTMSPVWCHFGGPGGASVLALLSSPQAVDVAGRRCLAVLVPTAPVPVGGGLLYVPEEWVSAAPVSIEALTSLYVSMGVTSPQHLPPAPAAAGAAQSAARNAA